MKRYNDYIEYLDILYYLLMINHRYVNNSSMFIVYFTMKGLRIHKKKALYILFLMVANHKCDKLESGIEIAHW